MLSWRATEQRHIACQVKLMLGNGYTPHNSYLALGSPLRLSHRAMAKGEVDPSTPCRTWASLTYKQQQDKPSIMVHLEWSVSHITN